MSFNTIVFATLTLALLGLLLGIMAWGLAHFVGPHVDGRLDLSNGGLLIKVVFSLAIGAGAIVGVALVGLVLAGLWWGGAMLLVQMTPGKLALFSIAIGAAPLIIAACGSGLAHALGGTVDASGARNCFFLGINLGPTVYNLFMSFWLALFTGGVAMLGLMGSGIWAIVRAF